MARKLLISISTFIFALLAFTGATVAWFTLSDEVTIEGFDMNITSGENLQVEVYRLVGTEWVWTWDNTITPTDIANTFRQQIIVKQGEVNVYEVGALRLEPLTSFNGVDFYNHQLPNLLGESVYSLPKYKYSPPTTTTNATHQLKFFELELKFRSMSNTSNLSVYLNEGGSADEPAYPVTWISNSNSSVDMAGAVRMAFVVDNLPVMIYERDADIFKKNSFDNTQIPGNAKDFPTWVLRAWDAPIAIPVTIPATPVDGDQYVDVINPTNARLYTYDGSIWDQGVYIQQITGTPGANDFGTYFNPATVELFKATVTTLSVQETTSALYDFTAEGEANSYLFSLAPGEGANPGPVKTVTIRIWIEGWDAKTIDALWLNTTELQRQLKVSLNFKGIPQ